MKIVLTPTDTSFSYICDWQYRDSATTGLSGKNQSLLLMSLNKRVFGNVLYKIVDSTAYGVQGAAVKYVKLKSDTATNRSPLINARTEDYWEWVTVEVCAYEYVPINNGQVVGCEPGPNCPQYTEELVCNYFQVLAHVVTGSGGGSSGGNGGNTGGSGGGGYNGGGTPPVCEAHINPDGTVVCDPGWTPTSSGGTNPPYDPNNAASIIIDSSISNNYPCLTNLLQTIPNINKEAQLLLDSTFNVSSYVNLTFAIDPNLGINNNPALTYPTSVQTIYAGGVSYFNDTIFINPYYVNNATKEFMVSVIYHEAIHAYINYQFYRYSVGEIADSNIIKSQFPIFWNQLSNTYALTGSIFPLEHHEQMAQSYVNTIKNLVLPFYNPIASQALKDRVTSSLAWGGLRQTTTWRLPGKDTCQINSDLLTASRANQTTVYSSGSCPQTVSDITMLKLSQPCN
jgi:hypothetical protein